MRSKYCYRCANHKDSAQFTLYRGTWWARWCDSCMRKPVGFR